MCIIFALCSHYNWCCTAAPHNVITDGFYEVGQLKHSDPLRSLEEYGTEEVSDRRLVIIINPKPESVNLHAAYMWRTQQSRLSMLFTGSALYIRDG